MLNTFHLFSPTFACCGRHLIKGSRPENGLNWLKLSEFFLKIGHLRLILKARCGKHSNYPLKSQHLTDIHQLIVLDIHIDPYLASYNAQKSQIMPFSAKMAPKWPFLTIFTEIRRWKHPEPGQNVSGCWDLTATHQFQAFKKILHSKIEPKGWKMAKNGNKWLFLAYLTHFGPLNLW